MLLPTMYIRWPLVCMAIATATRPWKGGILIWVQVLPSSVDLKTCGRLGLGPEGRDRRSTTAARALRGGQHDTGLVVCVLQVARAVVVGGLENVGPGLAAIGGAVDTAAVVCGVAEGGDDHQIGIVGIDQDAVDLHGVLQADVLPGVAGIGGLPHAVAEAAADGIASAGINDVGIGGSDLDRADAIHALLLVEDGEPGHAGAGGFPDAALRRADVEHAGLADDAGDRRDAAAVERSDVTPLEAGIEVGIDLRRRAQS